jgi:hypothetical protein
MKIRILILILILHFSCGLLAQDEFQVLENHTFSSKYDIDIDRTGKSLVKLNDGVISLSETKYGKGIIAKHDFNGKIMWEKYFDGEKINDIEVYQNYIYAVGYKYSNNKAWVSKIDSNGNIIWEKLLRIQYENEVCKISISKNGEIYLLCEIQKSRLPIKISFKKKFRNLISFRSRKKDNFESQIAIVRIDDEGKCKWRKIFGKQKNNNTYFAGIISSNDNTVIATFSFSEFKVGAKGTKIVILDKNGKSKSIINHQNRIFDVIKYDGSEFQTFEDNNETRLDKLDTIIISRIGKQKLEAEKMFISKFHSFNITSQLSDDQNLQYFGGSVFNYKTLGTLWNNHEDIYIIQLDTDFKIKREYQFNLESIDRINDMLMIDNKIYAIGESWTTENGKIIIQMRLMVLK